MARAQYVPLCRYLYTHPDPRDRRGRRYAWSTLLELLAAGLVAGCRGPLDLARWARLRRATLDAALALRGARTPSEATFRWLLGALHVATIEELVAEHNRQQAPGEADAVAFCGRDGRRRRLLAVDGKVVCGANARGNKVWLVSLSCPLSGRVLAQRRVACRSGEVPCAHALLAGRDLRGTIVAVDAGLAHAALAARIVAQGGDYLMLIKGNQPTVQAALAEHFALPASRGFDAEREQTTQRETGHGRREERWLACTEALNDWLDWPGLGQALVRENRVVDLHRGAAREVRRTYALTSLSAEQAGAGMLLALCRARWGIENRVHWRRDVTLNEDRCAVAKGDAPQVLAALRNAWLAIVAGHEGLTLPEATAQCQADPIRALQLVGALLTTA